MNEKNPIYTLIVYPRNQFYTVVKINDNDEKAMKHEDLYQFLLKTCPALSYEINDLFWEHKSFIIIVQDKIIKELTLDSDKEMEDLRNNFKKEDYKKAMNYTTKKPETLEQKLEKYSKNINMNKFLK